MEETTTTVPANPPVKARKKAKLREASLMIATGRMGVGKSYETIENMIPAYMRVHKKKRKVLMFDVNNEFTKIKSVMFDVEEVQAARQLEKKKRTRILTKSEKRIASLFPGQIRRIAPFTKHGYPMNTEQKRLTFETLLETFRGGLVHFEDINKYISAFGDDKVTGAFKAIRHNSQDITLHMQSMLPVRPLLLEAATCFRMHFDGIDLCTSKFDRFGSHAEIFRIAQLVVKDEFLMQHNPHYFCYVYHQNKKLRGISEGQFERACNEYLTIYKTEVERKALLVAEENKRLKPNFDDKKKAKFQWIAQRKEMYLS